ncbi:flavoprotein [Acetobacterium paludosum]|uniref:Flavoprotein n=1 Tax=Acetobacterium paludosum TaxID=52693 RepID=A0A923HXK4_9FIRM|nr:flavoprotein [Acetobacterium paludosum]MBC3889015.1 flavoprotein [Acetobacterium paludosum]
MLNGKTITLGITACSPAVKALDLIKELRHLGAEVHVIMTPNSVNFVTPLMIQREAGTPIQIEQFELPKAYDLNHQAIAVKSDLMLIAPASANTLGKAANGIADNLLSTSILSAKSPLLVATHINPTMYSKPSVQRNIDQLKADGFIFVENSNSESKYPSLFPGVDAIIESVKKILAPGYNL